MSDQVIKNPVLPQGWLRVLLFGCGFFLLTLLLAATALMTITGTTLRQLETNPLPTISGLLTGSYLWLMVLLELVISLVCVAVFRQFVDRRSFMSLGWPLMGYINEALTGLLMGPGLMGLTAVLLLLSGHLEWTDIVFDPSSFFVSFGLMVFIAFSEELVFRGYILGNLLDSFSNKWIALGISAFLFACFHLTNPGMHTLAFANLFLAGLLLGINYIFTRNLWFSFLFHLTRNFFQGPILGFRVSGLNLPSVLQADPKGDLFLTGGDFGLEGSILNTAVSLISLLVPARAFEKNTTPTPRPISHRQNPAQPDPPRQRFTPLTNGSYVHLTCSSHPHPTVHATTRLALNLTAVHTPTNGSHRVRRFTAHPIKFKA
ncbi:CPBP family intramembrane glutamic endopeptidase [Puia sp. P3]|uniref:CPBP family intramembrane glutamic endopeptidase n=1 Tax=Puia sp. P3 TaxID=3423952 RepID=UPI003D67658D